MYVKSIKNYEKLVKNLITSKNYRSVQPHNSEIYLYKLYKTSYRVLIWGEKVYFKNLMLIM